MNFAYHRPKNLDQAASLLQRYGDKAAILAGGTDLLVELKRGLRHPAHVIDVKEILELACLEKTTNGELHLGPLLTLQSLSSAGALQGGWNLLAQAASKVGSWQVRSRGTLGGNICNASPSGDTLPALLCLDARVKMISPRGERNMTIEEFFLGPGETALERGELLTEVILPPLPAGAKGVYKKFSLRRAMDLAMVGTAVLAWGNFGMKRIEDVRIGLGAVGPKPIRARRGEQALKSTEITEAVLAKAADLAAEETAPISDIRGSDWYRREMTKHLIGEAVREILGLSQPNYEEAKNGHSSD
jgi:CO/xanthine dehydrogenase FAD-binding subunit